MNSRSESQQSRQATAGSLAAYAAVPTGPDSITSHYTILHAALPAP